MALKIVLLGKTGHGKSSTGNTLLNMDVFRHEGGPNSTTQLSHSCTTTYGQSTLCVIDTPGNFETDDIHKKNYDYEKACNIMFTLMKDVSDSGVNAFFFIYNINNVYSVEEEKTIDLLETIFGHDVIKTFGVLVFTHGDLFDKNFEVWKRQPTGRIGELMNKFSGKFVIIANNGKSTNLINHSREAMINQALAIQKLGRKYTFYDYMQQKSSRELLLVNEKLSGVKAKFKIKIDGLERSIKDQTSINKAEAKKFHKKIKKIEKKVNAKIQEKYELGDQIDRLDYLTYLVNSKNKGCIIS